MLRKTLIEDHFGRKYNYKVDVFKRGKKLERSTLTTISLHTLPRQGVVEWKKILYVKSLWN